MMKNLLLRAGAIALALFPSLASAQSTGSSVQFPAGWAPSTSVCVKQADGTCVPVSAANPLPITGGTGGGGGGDPSSTGTAGSAPPANGSVTLFSDGSVLRRPLVDSSGRQIVVVYSMPTTAVTGTFWQTTQPISAASLPLPTGAASAAKQPALGTAGTPSADVLSIQGVSGGTPQSVTQPDTYGSGSVAAATLNSAYSITPANGQDTARFTVTGLTGTGAVLTLQVQADGSTWQTANGKYVAATTAPTTISAATITADGVVTAKLGARRGARLIVTTAGSAAAVTIASTASVASDDPLSASLDTNRDLRIPTVTITETNVSLSANASGTLIAANTARIGIEVQCDGTAAVGVSMLGTTLTSVATSPKIIVAGTYTLYVPIYASKTAWTYYTTTAQVCRVTQYAQQ